MHSNPALDRLTDEALLHQFSDLVRQDRQRCENLLRHIDAIDRRKLWAKYGHPSLFDFLVRRHHMSESTAGKRIGAARTARRFPVLFEMVGRGEIHLSGVHRLKAHLTSENHEHVLAQAKHKTMRQLEELVACLAPQPDTPSTLRALPRSPDPAPLSPGRYRLQVTLGEDACNKLKQLKDLLAHQIPNGDPALIIERALDALLTQVHKRKTGMTDRPRAPHVPKPTSTTGPSTRRSHLKSAVRREVWPRDHGRCGFVGEDGHRCNETRGLEFAHVYPWAKGGADTATNVGLRCMTHNALEAERDFGTRFMANKRARKPLKVREPVASYGLRTAPHAQALDRRADRVHTREARPRLHEPTPALVRGP